MGKFGRRERAEGAGAPRHRSVLPGPRPSSAPSRSPSHPPSRPGEDGRRQPHRGLHSAPASFLPDPGLPSSQRPLPHLPLSSVLRCDGRTPRAQAAPRERSQGPGQGRASPTFRALPALSRGSQGQEDPPGGTCGTCGLGGVRGPVGAEDGRRQGGLRSCGWLRQAQKYRVGQDWKGGGRKAGGRPGGGGPDRPALKPQPGPAPSRPRPRTLVRNEGSQTKAEPGGSEAARGTSPRCREGRTHSQEPFSALSGPVGGGVRQGGHWAGRKGTLSAGSPPHQGAGAQRVTRSQLPTTQVCPAGWAGRGHCWRGCKIVMGRWLGQQRAPP